MKTLLTLTAIAIITTNTLAAEPHSAPIPTFKTITVPLVIEQATFEGTFIEKEGVRWKQDVKDPWHWVTSVLSSIDPTGLSGMAYPAYKRWNDAYTYPNSQTNRIIIGEMMFSETILAGLPASKLGPFFLRQVSIPLVIRPTWSNITDFANDFSHVAIELRVVSSSGNESALQICDILPNTQFVPANYGGKSTFNIGVQSNRKWGPIDASATAGSSFWWEWNPKVNIVSSGAAGDTAIIVLNKKPDQSGWIGKLPIELLLMVPGGMDSARIVIRSMLVYRNNQQIPLAEVTGEIHFYDEEPPKINHIPKVQ